VVRTDQPRCSEVHHERPGRHQDDLVQSPQDRNPREHLTEQDHPSRTVQQQTGEGDFVYQIKTGLFHLFSTMIRHTNEYWTGIGFVRI